MPTFESKTFSFTVDLPGLIDLMGTALNRHHPLVDRVFERINANPLAAVLRVPVFQAVQSAGTTLFRDAREQIEIDLEKTVERITSQ